MKTIIPKTHAPQRSLQLRHRKISTDRWLKKLWYTYIRSGFFLTHEKPPLKCDISHNKTGSWRIIHYMKSARQRKTKEFDFSYRHNFKNIQRNQCKTQKDCWEFKHKESQKSNNKGAGIKSEILKNIYAGICICNDNPSLHRSLPCRVNEAMSHAV